MSGGSRVSATSATSAISVPTRVFAGAGVERIQGIAGAQQLSSSGQWRSRYDDGFSREQYDQQGQEYSQQPFTPLVGNRAAAFPANEDYAGGTSPLPLFSSDLQRAVGIYEFNMTLFAGRYVSQGSVINRFS